MLFAAKKIKKRIQKGAQINDDSISRILPPCYTTIMFAIIITNAKLPTYSKNYILNNLILYREEVNY